MSEDSNRDISNETQMQGNAGEPSREEVLAYFRNFKGSLNDGPERFERHWRVLGKQDFRPDELRMILRNVSALSKGENPKQRDTRTACSAFARKNFSYWENALRPHLQDVSTSYIADLLEILSHLRARKKAVSFSGQFLRDLQDGFHKGIEKRSLDPQSFVKGLRGLAETVANRTISKRLSEQHREILLASTNYITDKSDELSALDLYFLIKSFDAIKTVPPQRIANAFYGRLQSLLANPEDIKGEKQGPEAFGPNLPARIFGCMTNLGLTPPPALGLALRIQLHEKTPDHDLRVRTLRNLAIQHMLSGDDGYMKTAEHFRFLLRDEDLDSDKQRRQVHDSCLWFDTALKRSKGTPDLETDWKAWGKTIDLPPESSGQPNDDEIRIKEIFNDAGLVVSEKPLVIAGINHEVDFAIIDPKGKKPTIAVEYDGPTHFMRVFDEQNPMQVIWRYNADTMFQTALAALCDPDQHFLRIPCRAVIEVGREKKKNYYRNVRKSIWGALEAWKKCEEDRPPPFILRGEFGRRNFAYLPLRLQEGQGALGYPEDTNFGMGLNL